jgi:hypothetical protein
VCSLQAYFRLPHGALGNCEELVCDVLNAFSDDVPEIPRLFSILYTQNNVAKRAYFRSRSIVTNFVDDILALNHDADIPVQWPVLHLLSSVRSAVIDQNG